MTERAKETVKLSVGAIVQVVLILVTVVSLFKTLEAKTNSNEVKIVEHKDSDKEKWAKSDESIREIEVDVEQVKERIHANELQMSRQETHYEGIMRMLIELKADAKDTKRVLGTLERSDVNK